MQVNINSTDELRDFVYSDTEAVPGAHESYQDHFTSTSKFVDFLSTDLSLDDSILDFDDWA